jgi:hypothetical protein
LVALDGEHQADLERGLASTKYRAVQLLTGFFGQWVRRMGKSPALSLVIEIGGGIARQI